MGKFWDLMNTKVDFAFRRESDGNINIMLAPAGYMFRRSIKQPSEKHMVKLLEGEQWDFGNG